MPWVRFDDQYPDHPKIGPLTDRLYRLHNRSVFWCSRHTTDGVIRAELLPDVWRKAKPADAAELVARRLWHTAHAPPCPSPKCPPPGPDGWVVHDYWDYQPARSQVEKDRHDRAERTRRWRERRRKRDTSQQHGGDALPPEHGDQSPSPPRPAPKEAGGGAPRSGPPGPEPPPAASSAGGAAGGEQPKSATTSPNTTPPPPAPPPADQLAAARQAIAASRTRLNTAGHRRQDALAELRQATPDVPIPADQEGPKT